ncbi:UNVERIFIED_ORG: folate-binding protein YgfZ [Xanthobacter viscosus]|jgi:folate-binding protein YgfZ|uniref:Folate-binding protein YgfZ n=1 Tax=Xanthobacter autotrophicus TaxID=280 RepID=A0A6C1KUS0_XANAU|nr:folate-binding protein YgfZ [Xanthobacter autotrophicus]TLX42953.1 folate-binding protein YgfZ [Xanthobacter autotrophicus]
MPVVYLTDRVLIRATGLEASKFLHGVITCNVQTMAKGDSRYGALLTPQGKIISDFLFYAEGEDAFLFDVPAERAEDLLKRLTFHRLRAKVTFAKADDFAVVAVFGDAGEVPEGAVYPDPRLAALGQRLVLPLAAAQALSSDAAPYEAHRIALGIPKGGPDFAYGDTFPHEADMDQLGGVDFKKGCYVGQEVVSRMEHRSTPRNRLVEVLFDTPLATGQEITAGDKSVGQVLSVTDGRGIATVRLDRANDAKTDGVPLLAGEVPVELRRPDWAVFSMEWEKKVSELDRKFKGS